MIVRFDDFGEEQKLEQIKEAMQTPKFKKGMTVQRKLAYRGPFGPNEYYRLGTPFTLEKDGVFMDCNDGWGPLEYVFDPTGTDHDASNIEVIAE